jgi:hypothetical protein
MPATGDPGDPLLVSLLEQRDAHGRRPLEVAIRTSGRPGAMPRNAARATRELARLMQTHWEIDFLEAALSNDDDDDDESKGGESNGDAGGGAPLLDLADPVSGLTALHFATIRLTPLGPNDPEIAAALLTSGASPLAGDVLGRTALHHAVAQSEIKLLDAILAGTRGYSWIFFFFFFF